jgi:ATP-dependent DNA helicase HFM1/MER3
MNRGMDRHLKRIMDMDNATDGHGSSRPERALNYSFNDARPTEYSSQPTSGQPDQDPMLLNDIGKLSCCVSLVYRVLNWVSLLDRGSYDSESSRKPLTTSNTAPSRLSLAPRNIHAQSGNEPRTITNADNHFRFAQNLRQGLPVNRVAPPQANNFSNHQTQSPLTQLANNMLLQRPMPQASPEVNLFQGMNPSRLNQLQPRRQEITPPFNLSK